MKQTKTEDDDYYLDDDGRVVFSANYHSRRGYCCGNGCRHCPFNYEAVAEPRRTQLLKGQNAKKG